MNLRNDEEEDRPSRLLLDRFATGELKGEERARVQAWLERHPEAFAHLEELKAARSRVRPLDVAALRARAATLDAGFLEGTVGSTPESPDADVDDATPAFNDMRDIAASAGVLVDETPAPPPVVEEEDDEPAATERLPNRSVPSMPSMSSVVVSPTSMPAPANRRMLWAMFSVIAVAAVALFALYPRPTPPDIRIRGSSELLVYHLENGRLAPYSGAPLGSGDVVGFQVAPGSHKSVVVLSVDGSGNVSVYEPESGDLPLQIPTGGAAVPLPGSVTLDGAAGPEVFVAVFDQNVAPAKDAVKHAFESGGAPAVTAWAGQSGGSADAVVVERKKKP